jgi:adenosylmethionine---8-amino-7-oxononanoate aminotransferase
MTSHAPHSSRREELEALDKAHLWHPFTQMKEWNAARSLIIERGEGCYLYDVEGNRYLDGVSSLWVTTHGHQTPEIDAAVRAQLEKVAHSTLLGLANAPAIELAAKLARIAPGNLNKVFYSDSGSTAVEIALKIAFQYWRQRVNPRPQKTKFLHVRESYHGDTIGSVSVGGIDLFHQLYRPLLFDAHRTPAPHCFRCPLNVKFPECGVACADEIETILRTHADEIAAFVMEPVMMGAAGMIAHPPGYLKRARELCAKYDVLLICDEVATGFGRTGWMFACESEGVTPDILCVAKGLTGGYLPLAATIATDEIYGAFLDDYDKFKTFFHGHTYTGNPLACAAALANLELFETRDTLTQVRQAAEHLGRRLDDLASLPHVGDVRRRGLMAGVELVRDKATLTPYPAGLKMGYRVTERCRDFGLILRPLGNVVVMMPPLAISTDQIDFMAETVARCIAEVTQE